MSALISVLFLMFTLSCHAQFENQYTIDVSVGGSGVKLYSGVDPFVGQVSQVNVAYNFSSISLFALYQDAKFSDLNEDHFLGKMKHSLAYSAVGVGLRYILSAQSYFYLSFQQYTLTTESILTYSSDGSLESQSSLFEPKENGYSLGYAMELFQLSVVKFNIRAEVSSLQRHNTPGALLSLVMACSF